MFFVYWLISEDRKKTYVGFTHDLKARILEHRNGWVRTTRKFGNFLAYKLEQVETLGQARKREKYWKSASGRKKLKECFKNLASSSNG